MNLNIQVVLCVALLLLYLDMMVIGRLVINRIKKEQSQELAQKQNGAVLQAVAKGEVQPHLKKSLPNYFQVRQAVELSSQQRENLEKNVGIDEAEKKYLKKLKSIFKDTRIEAAVHLGLIGTETARKALENVILKEKSHPVKLYMANALADIKHKDSIPVLIASLIHAHFWYRKRCNMLIADFGETFDHYVPQLIKSDKIEVKELLVDFSKVYFSENIKNCIMHLMNTKDDEMIRIERLYGADDRNNCTSYGKLVYSAAETLAVFYPEVLADDKYLYSKDVQIQNIALGALAHFNKAETLTKLLLFLREEETAKSAASSIASILQRNPSYINKIIKIFSDEKDLKVKQKLAEILSHKIEYLIMKLTSSQKNYAANIIKEILLLGKSSQVIDFLNKNKDIDIENELILIIKEVIPFSEAVRQDCAKYLNERITKKCGIEVYQEPVVKREEKKDPKLTQKLYILLALSILIFPVIYIIRHEDILLQLTVLEQIKIYVVDFNYYLAFYSIAVNSIYLMLLFLSDFNTKRQLRLWKIKNISLLFKKNMLPAISIIAPAFNEEMTIVESANSLLNLKYPDYELIIVNDGSKDSTLDILIKYFNLMRVDYTFEYKLSTKLVRGVYINPSMPKLIVVDKENGGKADSLNAGINISKKEYFCGIDADSLLEEDALLKLASLTLDEGVETPALGGNIFPINGCSVERGQIKNIRIPQNKLARLQTIEYIRAFMAGRLGWAFMNSLLIISGAFGLFRKERVISVGGYLTSSGKYGKDTVGEDMELVVRISRLMREMNHKYRICYAFNANCWTEVPEDLGSLKKQRYRWHRGLIDILTFHQKMLFNPRYGRTGMVAMPYFFVFEMIGPIIEFQGYIMVIIAFLLGVLNAEIAAWLFVSTILMGVLVSVSSLLISEKDTKQFSFKELMILASYSIAENFGPRQFLSFWRVGGYISMLKKPSGWGKPERKGFSASNNGVKG